MITFKQYLQENTKSTLHVFDVDDTLVHSNAKVHVKDAKGKTVEKLNTSDYNHHNLPHGHHYDYHEFKSAHVFSHSKPIHKMIKTINATQATTEKNPKNKVVINTARADFDDKHKFLSALQHLGIKHMDKIHVHRAGNIPGNEKPAKKKLVFIRQHLDKHPYSHVKMYDDSMENLSAFHGLKNEYPHVKFHAYHVHHDGTMKKV
jgi:FMN phosphatase YigB (HAD superfamily)